VRPPDQTTLAKSRRVGHFLDSEERSLGYFTDAAITARANKTIHLFGKWDSLGRRREPWLQNWDVAVPLANRDWWRNQAIVGKVSAVVEVTGGLLLATEASPEPVALSCHISTPS